MSNYIKTIQQLNSIRDSLQDQLAEIKKAASISYDSWDSDARNAYQEAIDAIIREINYIIAGIDNLKQYVYKEDEMR